MQNCDKYQELINFLLDEASPQEKKAFLLHITECAECAEEVQASQSLIETIKLDIPEQLTSDRRKFILTGCEAEKTKVTLMPIWHQFLKAAGVVAAMLLIMFTISKNPQPNNFDNQPLLSDTTVTPNKDEAIELPTIGEDSFDSSDYQFEVAMLGGLSHTGQCIVEILRSGTSSSSSLKPAVTTLVLDTSSLKNPQAIKQQLNSNLRNVLKGMQNNDRVSLLICGVNGSALPPKHSSITINQIIASVGRIRLTGSTALKDGVYNGFQHALSRFEKQSHNKLIFLASNNEPINLLDRQQIKNCLNECSNQQIALAMVGFSNSF